MIALLDDLKMYRGFCYPGSSLPVAAVKVILGHPAVFAVMLFRWGNWGYRMRIPVVRHLVLLIHWLFFPLVRLLTGVQLLPQTRIGPGLALLHYGPTIIHPNTHIVGSCVIYHCVTFASDWDHSAPTVEPGVQIGTGAVLFGRITVGDHTMIGAGAVVTKPIPRACIAAGVPAKVVRYREHPSDAPSSSA